MQEQQEKIKFSEALTKSWKTIKARIEATAQDRPLTIDDAALLIDSLRLVDQVLAQMKASVESTINA